MSYKLAIVRLILFEKTLDAGPECQADECGNKSCVYFVHKYLQM